MLGGEGVVVKDEGVQDSEGNVYGLEDGRRDGEQEGSQEAMAGFGQVSSSNKMFFNIQLYSRTSGQLGGASDQQHSVLVTGARFIFPRPVVSAGNFYCDGFSAKCRRRRGSSMRQPDILCRTCTGNNLPIRQQDSALSAS